MPKLELWQALFVSFSTLYALFHMLHIFVFIFLFEFFSNLAHLIYIPFIFPTEDAFIQFCKETIHSKNYSSTKKKWNISFKEIIHSFEKLIVVQGYLQQAYIFNIWLYIISNHWIFCEVYPMWIETGTGVRKTTQTIRSQSWVKTFLGWAISGHIGPEGLK